MRQLRYAGPGEDAAHVVVEALDGPERFTLVLDDALRAAARQELPRPGRAEEATVTLSPRDIQTRVRAGASPEVVAEEADLPVEKVMRFAFPVLQERARVAGEARRARARQTPESTATLGETVDTGFGVHGIDPDDVAWDSFRRPDGQWTVTAGWRHEGEDRFAQWNFVLSTRAVGPLDDAADDLLHGRPLRPLHVPEPEPAPAPADLPGFLAVDAGAPHDPAAAARPTGPIPGGLRLAPAPGVADLPVGDDGLPPVDPFAGADWPADPAPRGLGSFFDPPARRGHHPSSGPLPVVEPGADADAGVNDDEPPLPFDFDTRAVPAPVRGRRGRHASGGVEAGEGDDDGKAARARIPSWDDILLGVRRRGD